VCEEIVSNDGERLGAEATSIIGAGTETTAWTLSVITYYLLAHPSIRSKLEAELQTVVQDPKNLPSWTVLEKLPYLTATILEAIRHSLGVGMRLARIAPDKALIYEGSFKPPNGAAEVQCRFVIPPGTPIGMSNLIMHSNATIFPEPASYVPERWLKEDGTRRTDLERYLMSFNKGSRQCLGMNLAYCELYFAVTALVLRVFPHMELFETTEEDIKYHHDLFIPQPRPESLGLRVLVK